MEKQESRDTRSHPFITPAVVWSVIVTAVVLVIAGLIVVAVHYGTEVNVLVLTVDPVAEVGLAPYVGVFSHIGVLLHWSAATVALLSSWLLRNSGQDAAITRLLFGLGALSGWLALDDLFLIHEEIGLWLAKTLDRLEDRSLLEAPVFLAYGLVWILLLMQNRSVLRQTPYLLLVLALAGFGLSIAIDIGEFILPDIADSTPWMKTTISMAEDIAKLGGILFLLHYILLTGASRIRDSLAPGAGADVSFSDRAVRSRN